MTIKKKIRDIRSEMIDFDEVNNQITLQLHDTIDLAKADELSKNGRHFTYLDFHDTETITDAQRDHYWALVGDIHEHTGFPINVTDSHLRFEFMSHYLLDEYPSVSRGSMLKSTASELLTFVIDYCIQNDIPFRKQQFYLTADVSRMLYAMTMKRICWVCGKKGSSIHHAVNLVGMGNDRTKFNHLKSKFMCLCESGHEIDEQGNETGNMASHHREADAMGAIAFSKKYHVYPIKLSKRDLKRLGIQGNYKEETK